MIIWFHQKNFSSFKAKMYFSMTMPKFNAIESLVSEARIIIPYLIDHNKNLTSFVILNLQDVLKRGLRRNFNLSPSTKELKKLLIRFLSKICMETVSLLIDSMPRRMWPLIRWDGDPTQYWALQILLFFFYLIEWQK